ncbi:LysR family transcriptional regulator [uncultured Comamonas sp.]|uniref:LysR family transcriptional regulator n=1 Tax=uncultured Comamonas sp. TaxID=114710 RepID=UPI0025E752DA|nr:LysR family transcriptional regulator [uncultured Comamonas sp.]
MSITLRQLEVFVAVSEEGSLTRAGEVLGLPQSSISTQLKELEELLGLKLFDRHTRMLRLTEGGMEILPLAKKTLADLGAMLDGSAQLKTLERGRVSIAASSMQAALVLPRMVKAFNEMHPGIRIELMDVTQDEVIQMVIGGAVDFGVGTAFGDHGELTMKTLWSEPFFAVLQPDHALAKKKSVTWKELQKFSLIGSRKGNPVRTALEFSLASEGIALKYVHEAALPLTIIGMVAGGLGVGILTGSTRRLSEALGLLLKPISQPRLEREVVLVLHSARSLSPAAKKFNEALIGWTSLKRSRFSEEDDAQRFCNVCYQFGCSLTHAL